MTPSCASRPEGTSERLRSEIPIFLGRDYLVPRPGGNVGTERRGDSDEPALDSPRGGAGSGIDTELAEDVGDVGVDGAVADEKRGPNLAIGLPGDEQPEHLQLATSQPEFLVRDRAGGRPRRRHRFSDGLLRRQ